MKFLFTTILFIFLTGYLFSQSDDDIASSTGPEVSDSPGLQGAFGAVTIDGQIYNQFAFRPTLPLGKFRIALDMVLYLDENGKLRTDDWDFSSLEAIKNTVIDKIYYFQYGKYWDNNYFKVGALDKTTIGYGILMENYSNTILYPEVRKVGMEFRSKVLGLDLFGFTNNLKENFGLNALRVSAPAPVLDFLEIGFSWVGDRNQYLGLVDRDDDGRPDLVDDFPDDEQWWLDTDGDGLADGDTINEFDVDGDGWTDSSFTFPTWGIVIDPDGVSTKPEPINIKEESKSFNAVSLDLGLPLVRTGALNVAIYSGAAALIGKTFDPVDSVEVDAGYGIIPLAFSAKFGKLRFNAEYRMIPDGNFEFGYFNKTYMTERATFQSISGNQGTIITKSEKLGTYGKQSGYYSSLDIDLGKLFDAGVVYQNLNGDQYDSTSNSFQSAANQSFSVFFELKKGKSIGKLVEYKMFYEQRNVPNPFDFEYSESTIMGYQTSLELDNGITLRYSFIRTFQDANGDGDVMDKEDMNNMINLETSFRF